MWHHIIIQWHFHQGTSAYDNLIHSSVFFCICLLCSAFFVMFSYIWSPYFVPGLPVVTYLASLFLKLTNESFFLFTRTVHTTLSLILPTFLYYASDFKYNVSSCSEILIYIYCCSMWRKLYDLYTRMLGLVLPFTNWKCWRFFALCKYEVQECYNITIHTLFRN